MAAGLSAKRQYEIIYRRLKKIEGDLNRAGIKAVYGNRQVVDEATQGKEFQIYYHRLNASNGECALFPVLYLNEGGTRVEYYFMDFEKGLAKLIAPEKSAAAADSGAK
jgi:hypothetical protein